MILNLLIFAKLVKLCTGKNFMTTRACFNSIITPHEVLMEQGLTVSCMRLRLGGQVICCYNQFSRVYIQYSRVFTLILVDPNIFGFATSADQDQPGHPYYLIMVNGLYCSLFSQNIFKMNPYNWKIVLSKLNDHFGHFTC